jgi:hypothetical protein
MTFTFSTVRTRARRRQASHLPRLIRANLIGGLTCIDWPAAMIAAFTLPNGRSRS